MYWTTFVQKHDLYYEQPTKLKLCYFLNNPVVYGLTHWGRVTHICVSELTIIGSDNGLSPGRRQAIIWTNAEILLIRTSGTNFSEILIEIDVFSFKKMHLKMSSGKWRPFLSRPQCVKTYMIMNQTAELDPACLRWVSWHAFCHARSSAWGNAINDLTLVMLVL